MRWLKASMGLSVVACVWGVHLFLVGAHDGPLGKAYAGLIMFAAGIAWAVVVRLVAWGGSQRIIIEKDERERR